MTRVIDIYHAIDEIAPFESAMDFDNVGILVGDREAEVNRALIALDITPAVAREAKEKNCNLIISHHPVIFDPLHTVSSDSVPYLLAQSGIHAICAHTNLDMCPSFGVNIALSKILGLSAVSGELEYGTGYILFSGSLPQVLQPEEFIAYVKKQLFLRAVRACMGDGSVSRVFFCTGSGGEYVQEALRRGADAYITGEMKHHEELYAAMSGMTVISAGHYETEKIFDSLLLEYLKRTVPNVGFIPAKQERPPFTVV